MSQSLDDVEGPWHDGASHLSGTDAPGEGLLAVLWEVSVSKPQESRASLVDI
jgi:hypothetical protein